MPPHRPHLLSAYVTSDYLWRTAKYLILATTVALAGCATNANRQHAESDSSSYSALDSYLSQTQSDPLGAYFATTPYTSSTRYDTISRYDSGTPRMSRAPLSDKPLAQTALNFLGIKYRFGGDTPNEGFDCSGLVAYVAEKSLGLKLPRRSAELAREGLTVDRDELKKGDLVFFNTRRSRNSHVGIYLGNHEFVHAPSTGSVVRIDSMDATYWKKRYNGARRLAANTTKIAALTGAADAADAPKAATRTSSKKHASKTTHARATAHSATRNATVRTRGTTKARGTATRNAATSRTRSASHVASTHNTSHKKAVKTISRRD
jgi:cell wall-associated NlpC family hydrolase